jgi:hypothetical protein
MRNRKDRKVRFDLAKGKDVSSPVLRPKGSKEFSTFSVRLRKDLKEGIEAVAAKSGYTRNEVISQFLDFALSQHLLGEARSADPKDKK